MNKKEIGQKLREIRRHRRISQREAGEHVGVTFQQIQKMETGANHIPSERLFKLLKFYDISLCEFMEGEDYLPSDEVGHMLCKFSLLPKTVQRDITDLINNVIERKVG